MLCYYSVSAFYVYYVTSGLPGRLSFAPAALGGAGSNSYTARLELATVVPRALDRCRFSKSHHRPARVARAASVVAPCCLATAYFVEIGNFAPFSELLHIKGRNFSHVFYPFTSTYEPYEP